MQVTVTTHSQGGKGFELYIDGQLVSQTLANETYTGVLETSHVRQLCLSGNGTICGLFCPSIMMIS